MDEKSMWKGDILMKYRIAGICMTVLMLLIVTAFLPVEEEGKSERIHQHLTAKKDTGCSCDKTQLCTHLPLVLIDTQGQEIPGEIIGRDKFGQGIGSETEDGEEVINVNIKVVDNDNANNHPSDVENFTSLCELRKRGNSSRYFSKPSYNLRFVDERGENRDIPVMGMGAHHEWVLNGPILDKSLVRNYVWYNIAGEIMDYAPNVRFCELMLDGEYQGIYLMVETITNGVNCRLNLKMNVRNSQTTGYLLKCDRPVEVDLGSVRDIYTYSERSFQIQEDVTVRYPGKSVLTEEIAEEIELDYAAFEKALFSYDYDTEDFGYWNWIDVDNFIDYCLINEFAQNVDAGRYSTYVYREVGEPIRLCVWDYNNACNNYRDNDFGTQGFACIYRWWYFMLLKDENFVEKMLDRYEELRTTYLDTKYLENYIDETVEYLGPAVERNSQRWGSKLTYWERLSPAERNPRSHAEAVRMLKEWIAGRGAWLDENIHVLRQYAHPSRNKFYNH